MINRNSPVGAGNQYDPGSQMLALLTETDFAGSTVNLDAAYVYSDDRFGSMFVVGGSAIRRISGYHNTYNISAHLLASLPDGDHTAHADQGELAFLQTSWTPHHTEDLVYLNGFWAIDQFTSATRGPLQGGPLGQTGIIFSAAGLGQSGAPIGVATNDTAGASLGYQLFFCETRAQMICEIGGFKNTKGEGDGVLGTAVRLQQAVGQHSIFIVDGFVTKEESQNIGQGARTELLIKF